MKMRTFKTGNFNKKALAVSENFLPVDVRPVAIAELVVIGVDTLLQRERKINFSGLNNQVRPDAKQEVVCALAGNVPAELRAMLRVSLGVVVNMNAATKSSAQLPDDGLVPHPDHDSDLVSGMDWTSDVFPNPDHPLTVEQPRRVFNFHGSSHKVTAEKIANSVEAPCPAQMGAEGQYRTKQKAHEPLGVCNEQVLSAKAKVCSEPGRNVGKSAEMTGSYYVPFIQKALNKVTDCNTKYLMFRPHAERNFVPIGGERQSVNQDAVVKLIGWAGNLTSSGSQFQGVLIA